jgi:hypothetical protein
MSDMKKITILLSICLLMTYCKKDNSGNIANNIGYEYYPTAIGSFVTYQVDSTNYNDFFVPVLVTNSSFQIKEKIESEFEDNLGRKSLRIERYIRNNNSENWRLLNVWYATRTERVLEKIEDNQRFIKLVFPPSKNTTWKGNKYIEKDVQPTLFDEIWNYKITSLDEPLSLGSKNYDSTLTVIQKEYIDGDSRFSLIDKVYSKEIFAKGVGMVYKELWNVQRQKNLNQPWLTSAERGYILKYTAIDYGIE